ncbi:hypothetical protein F5Y16DRAFT_399132 [Xylariaceae sp. FL0255]|nr:hypothetical protein F5Y16DRAFT_399132 [Xylariaceae sp. FL0255]
MEACKAHGGMQGPLRPMEAYKAHGGMRGPWSACECLEVRVEAYEALRVEAHEAWDCLEVRMEAHEAWDCLGLPGSAWECLGVPRSAWKRALFGPEEYQPDLHYARPAIERALASLSIPTDFDSAFLTDLSHGTPAYQFRDSVIGPSILRIEQSVVHPELMTDLTSALFVGRRVIYEHVSVSGHHTRNCSLARNHGRHVGFWLLRLVPRLATLIDEIARAQGT